MILYIKARDDTASKDPITDPRVHNAERNRRCQTSLYCRFRSTNICHADHQQASSRHRDPPWRFWRGSGYRAQPAILFATLERKVECSRRGRVVPNGYVPVRCSIIRVINRSVLLVHTIPVRRNERGCERHPPTRRFFRKRDAMCHKGPPITNS